MVDILLIEDEQGLRTMLKKTLEHEGYNVTAAADGRQGLRAFQSQKFDVVITDLIMPEMEGMETIISLRQSDPEVKIIAMSGGGLNNPEGYLEVARKLGAQKTFEKPFERELLIEAVVELTS